MVGEEWMKIKEVNNMIIKNGVLFKQHTPEQQMFSLQESSTPMGITIANNTKNEHVIVDSKGAEQLLNYDTKISKDQNITVKILYENTQNEDAQVDEAEVKAVKIIADILKENDWSVKRLHQCKDWEEDVMSRGWDHLVNSVDNELSQLNGNGPLGFTEEVIETIPDRTPRL